MLTIQLWHHDSETQQKTNQGPPRAPAGGGAAGFNTDVSRETIEDNRRDQ